MDLLVAFQQVQQSGGDNNTEEHDPPHEGDHHKGIISLLVQVDGWCNESYRQDEGPAEAEPISEYAFIDHLPLLSHIPYSDVSVTQLGRRLNIYQHQFQSRSRMKVPHHLHPGYDK